MSAIAGIWRWDGSTVLDVDLALLAEGCRSAGPDGGGTVKPMRGLALQAHLLRFDRLSASERQPYVFAHGSVLTWDGRLDNREDLLVTLKRDLDGDISDAALVAAAYSRWGLASLPRLIGDWSLAIWDASARQLLLARDYMGNRPLYYALLPNGIGWATCLDALGMCFDLYAEPDESYIAGKLTLGTPPDLTPFRRAKALRAGHYLIATPNQNVFARRYWTFEPSTIRYRRPEEYTHHLRQLLIDGVRVRLRAERTVWSHLSGGWDSSSITCIANSLTQGGFVEARTIQPLSDICTASPESDESRFIAAVERWCGLTSVKREFGGLATFAELLNLRHPLARPFRLEREVPMRSVGDRVVFSGELGDLVMQRDGSNNRLSVLEPLFEGHPLRSLRLCYLRAKRKRLPLTKTLARLALEVCAPATLRDALDQHQQITLHAHGVGLPTRDLAALFSVTPALLAKRPPLQLVSDYTTGFPVTKRSLVAGLYAAGDTNWVESSTYVPDIWRTFPFTHRPLVDLVLGAPQTAFWDPRVTRSGMQRALADVLPPEIQARSTKANPSAALMRATVEHTTELARAGLLAAIVENGEMVRRGYLDPKGLARFARPETGGQTTNRWPFKWLQFEAWLQNLSTLSREAKVRRAITQSECFVATDETSQQQSYVLRSQTEGR